MLQSGSELVLCLLLMEVSNPFLHARALLKVRPLLAPILAPR